MSGGTAARSKSRRFLLQAMYQAELTGEEYGSVADPFILDHNMKRADLAYFREILEGVHLAADELQNLITPKLDRAFAELDPIEKSILLLSAYELHSRLESFKLINSVLDKLSKEVRRAEL